MNYKFIFVCFLSFITQHFSFSFTFIFIQKIFEYFLFGNFFALSKRIQNYSSSI